MGTQTTIGADVFSAKGLGKRAAHLVDLLDKSMVYDDTAAVAAALGIAARAACRLIRRMRAVGLIDADRVARGPATLDDAARLLNVDGIGARRRARHALERASYHLNAARAARPLRAVPTNPRGGTGA